MARPTKMTPNITKKMGDNIALGLPYSLAAKLPELHIRLSIPG